MEKHPVVQSDILRYKKNKSAALLAILGIVFGVLYFLLTYALNNNDFYNPYMGLSVIVTLLVLLVAFYSSESVKNYKKEFCIVLLVLAAVQILRIFYFPLQVANWSSRLLSAKAGDTEHAKYVVFYFGGGLAPKVCSAVMIVWLVLSAACFVASAVLGYITAERLEKHMAAINSGEINMDAILSETDAFTLGAEKKGVE